MILHRHSLAATLAAAIMIAISVVVSCASAPKDTGGGVVERTSSAAVGREIARASVYVTAEALATIDQQCAVIALDRKDQPLATKCADVYKTVRPALLMAAVSVDAWDSIASKREDITCTVLESVTRVSTLLAELRSKGSPDIPIVSDAIKLATSLGQCPARKDGGT